MRKQKQEEINKEGKTSLKKIKKAQLSMQFNWIFILIVGGIILGFFLMVINGQQKKATTEEATDLVQRLDTVFTTLGKHPNSVDSFAIPKADIEYSCREDNSEYYIQGAGPIHTDFDIIFTQNKLQGRKIITWTKSWEAPFEVGIFTFMASDRTIFIFLNDDSENTKYIQKLYKELPTEFTKVLLESQEELTSFDLKGYDKYVLISTTQKNMDNVNSEIKEKTAIRQIKQVTGGKLGTYGQVFFESQNSFGATKPYLLNESLWGAIFAEDENLYECTMKKALKRLSLVANIHEQRSAKIAEELSESYCYDTFIRAEELFLDIQLESATSLNDLIDLSTIYEKGFGQAGLKQTYQDSLRGYNCPFIY